MMLDNTIIEPGNCECPCGRTAWMAAKRIITSLLADR